MDTYAIEDWFGRDFLVVPEVCTGVVRCWKVWRGKHEREAKQISLVPKDLALKHEMMGRDAFSFFRSIGSFTACPSTGSLFRWDLCPRNQFRP
jgi:hypothetical protein